MSILAYGWCQKLVANSAGKESIKDLSLLQNATAGFLAAFFSSFPLCPTELIKCKLQAMRETQVSSFTKAALFPNKNLIQINTTTKISPGTGKDSQTHHTIPINQANIEDRRCARSIPWPLLHLCSRDARLLLLLRRLRGMSGDVEEVRTDTRDQLENYNFHPSFSHFSDQVKRRRISAPSRQWSLVQLEACPCGSQSSQRTSSRAAFKCRA